jgi:hypothetical protein
LAVVRLLPFAASFIALSFVTMSRAGVTGLRLAFIGFVVLRAVALGVALPGVRVERAT